MRWLRTVLPWRQMTWLDRAMLCLPLGLIVWGGLAAWGIESQGEQVVVHHYVISLPGGLQLESTISIGSLLSVAACVWQIARWCGRVLARLETLEPLTQRLVKIETEVALLKERFEQRP
jgi:hypothetical protein